MAHVPRAKTTDLEGGGSGLLGSIFHPRPWGDLSLSHDIR